MTVQALPSGVVTRFVPRSSTRNKAVIVAGTSNYTHQPDTCSNLVSEISLTPEYRVSFSPKDIIGALFGPFLISSTNNDAQTEMLLIQGSTTKASINGNTHALVAENFYLPGDYFSQVTFSPRITNALCNYDLYVALDGFLSGFYARFYGAFTHATWNLRWKETVILPGSASIPGGFLTETDTPRDSLLPCFSSYVCGQAPQTTAGDGNFDGVPLSIALKSATIMNNLEYDRIQSGKKTALGFSDLNSEIGWDFCSCSDYHLGINIQCASPTGIPTSPDLLFSPAISENKWQLGGGITGHYRVWQSCDDDFSISVYFDGTLIHLFARTEDRVFDLKCAPLSRYILAQHFSSNVEMLGGSVSTIPILTPANVQFAYEVCPVANLTMRSVDVGYKAQTDIVLWLTMHYCGCNVDVGYNFWARSTEMITPSKGAKKCNAFSFNRTNNMWGLKGNVQIFGYIPEDVIGGVPAVAYPLSAMQSNAQLNIAVPNVAMVPGGPLNEISDNPQFAYIDGVPLVANPQIGVPDIDTSIQPILLTDEDIDYGQGLYSTSSTLFAHISVDFANDQWNPYIGCGGSVELGQHTNGSSVICSSLSQWSIWIKCGVAF